MSSYHVRLTRHSFTLLGASLGLAAIIAAVSLWRDPKNVNIGHIQDSPSPISSADASLSRKQSTASRAFQLEQGQTLIGLLTDAGINTEDVHQVLAQTRGQIDLNRLRSGTSVLIDFIDHGDRLQLTSLAIPKRDGSRLAITRAESGLFQARELRPKIVSSIVFASGKITRNLYDDARTADVPISVLAHAISAYSHSIDFTREIRAGDQFNFLYRAYIQEGSEQTARRSHLLRAEITLSGQRYRIYRFTPQHGQENFFDEKGQDVRRPLLRMPLDVLRVTSPYGMRRHPILRFTKMHKGVDFAAPKGTPILAAGSGIVKRAGTFGAYGRYVLLQHKNGLSTAYAHMDKIMKGVRPGKQVKQGQIIGRVGTTGRSTGPHLHYEVMRGKRRINPMDLKFQPRAILSGRDLEAFQARRAELDRISTHQQSLDLAHVDR